MVMEFPEIDGIISYSMKNSEESDFDYTPSVMLI